ncbi:hypothetical protein [Enterococcus haemoperoxidus]|uniref:hypothetical protein n=1 Tax=Enterococcus haemoperoxidus TaxID=155618 RepID=UPI001B804E32|nr:hypothetical protein [Enterococcus haemoperoxidus]
MSRIIKGKKKNYMKTFFGILKQTVAMTIINFFFVFSLIFQNSKKHEILISKNKKIDLQSVDTSGELINILSVLEKFFWLSGCLLFVLYILYLSVHINKRFLIDRENMLIKKLNGCNNSILTLEFTINQLFEVPATIFLGLLISSVMVKDMVSILNSFWLFEGVTYDNLSLLSYRFLISLLLPILILFVCVFFISFCNVKILKIGAMNLSHWKGKN